MPVQFRRLDPSKNEIRLIELLPARDTGPEHLHDPVQCRLITVPLTPTLDFIALSSLYGDLDRREAIWVNGSPVNVTEHLALALKHVRYVLYPVLQTKRGSSSSSDGNPSVALSERKRAPRWLVHILRVVGLGPDHVRVNGSFDRDGKGNPPLRIWADFLCINHSDDREKQKQRAVMRAVYPTAKMVVAWLGLKIEETDGAVEAVRDINEAMPPNFGHPDDRREHPEHYAPHHVWAAKLSHLWQPGPHFKGGNDILTRPYFSGPWMLEEMGLARFPAFLIGDTIISWKQMLRLNQYLNEMRHERSDVFPRALSEMLTEWPRSTTDSLMDDFARRSLRERDMLDLSDHDKRVAELADGDRDRRSTLTTVSSGSTMTSPTTSLTTMTRAPF